ncbi:deoxycytidine triphosphate deaminase [Candidatus Parcubacteria bacterium]|nr:MAG: deoxycytidine triphosphate deaminase [Candidatus Parcubacteria bacterium]
MLLSRDAILRHMQEGNIIIDPFDERKLNTASYDVTLGPWYWREKHPTGRAAVHNLYDERSTKLVWEGPFEAEPVEEVEKKIEQELKNVPRNARIILLGPGETILAHTEEYIGGRNCCVGKMYARSSLGRNFVEVCKDAGWGDVGYFNRWTMEVTNNSQHFYIPLVVGRRIAQMVFYEVEPITQREGDYVKEGGKYQVASELEELKRTWNPHMMVPQMHRDWEIEAGK